ncbi:MAG: DnaJ family molecular chaperone [Armatimonadota bacterium]
MTLAERLWRVARRGLAQGIGTLYGVATHPETHARVNRLREQARRELEEFLRGGGTPPPPPPGVDAPPRARPRRPHPYRREYELLGAEEGADLAAVKSAWRKRVRETHPDRFAHDPAEQQRAAARLREVNEAYYRLRDYLAREGRSDV